MMSSFDLADALEGPLEENVPTVSSCNTTQDVQRNTFRLEDGLDLVVSKDLKTFKRNAVLLMMVTRMKKPMGHNGNTLRENELCSAILGSLVEEKITKTTVSWFSKAKTFQRADSETQCTLSDLSQKSLILESEQMKLQAVQLKAGQENYKVNFTLSRYQTETPSGGQTFLLSINKYLLSCSMKEDRAELNLEISSYEDLEVICDETNMHRFLFWKTEITGLNKFESVSCPGWFISTSLESEKPVDMCMAEDRRNTYLRMV